MDSQNILFEIGGLFLVIFSSVKIIASKKILRNCKEVEGVVVDQELEYGANGDAYYYPKVKFKLEDGKSVVAKHDIGFNPATFMINEKVRIRYSVDDYEKFIINDIDNKANLILMSVGIFMIAYGIYHLIK
jgi:hypothetical protein